MHLLQPLQPLEQMDATDEDVAGARSWFADNPSLNISLRTFWKNIFLQANSVLKIKDYLSIFYFLLLFFFKLYRLKFFV